MGALLACDYLLVNIYTRSWLTGVLLKAKINQKLDYGCPLASI